MFHAVLYFIREFYDEHGPFDKILDVGSYDENGTIKDGIAESKNGKIHYNYTGIDMREGPNVDMVLNGHDLLYNPKTKKGFKKETFDLVICCETLEHDDQFWLTLNSMKKVLKRGGYLLITAPGLYFFEHNYPDDFYRFTQSAFLKVMFKDFGNVTVQQYQDKEVYGEQGPTSVMGYGKKIKDV